MKNRKYATALALIVLFIGLYTDVNSQSIRLSQSNESGIYRRGEKISVFAAGSVQPGDSVKISVLKNNVQTLDRKALFAESDSFEIFSDSLGEPCSIIIEARCKGGFSSTGLLVDPGSIKPGASCPKDFKSYWREQKRKLKSVPMEVKSTAVGNAVIEKGFTCSDVEINCPATKPARGYLAKPENPAPKSLPIVILVHAAGVKGSWCRSEPKNALNYAKMNALCFDLNAHGMLNGQPDSYYADLERGELNNYWVQGLEDRDNFYFRGMYLRLLRTLDFLTRQPEWDGKRILVMGESQGGGQALAAAGLDKRVSAVVAIVPAMCDWFGPLAGRMGGWPQPLETKYSKEKMQKVLPYFDNTNILRGSRATIFAEIGLIDMTCPSSSVYAALNQAKGRKIIYTVPYRPHQQAQGKIAAVWNETVYKPREAFIRDFLK